MPQLSHRLVRVGRKHPSGSFLDEVVGRRSSGLRDSNHDGRVFYGEEPTRHFLGIVTGSRGSGS